jgi:hypothetical protein
MLHPHEVVVVVQLIQRVALFFNIIFKHTDKFVPFWHKFEDFTVVKTVLWNSHLFTKLIFTSSLLWCQQPTQVQLQ